MLVSLGHSCQTRFIIDGVDASGRRMPFDFNITTRAALIAALASDGASLRHGEDNAAVFRMASDGREGIEAGGVYFWHDYPLAEDRLRLADGWQRDIARVNEKYAALWQRLSTLLRSDEEKTLVLSNSQHNLSQFAADDEVFQDRFGLGRQAFEEIAAALDGFGARNYRLLLLTRSIAELAETAGLRDERLDHRFVGLLSLRPDARVAASVGRGLPETDLSALCGSYDGGRWTISAHSRRAALVHGRTDSGPALHGSLTAGHAGLILWLEGRDRFSDVKLLNGAIHFTDGTTWRRD